MNAKEFINLDLQPGDRVRVTLGEAKHEGFFGGYKAFEGTHSYLEYGLYPVFYAIGKNDQMVQRSMVPGRTPYWGFSSITSIEKITIKYRWVAYIDSKVHSIDAATSKPKTILEEYKKYRNGQQSRYSFCDVENMSLFDKCKFNSEYTMLENGKYAVYVFYDNNNAFVRIFERTESQ